MQMQVINRSDYQVAVKIVNEASKKTDSMFIQPKAATKLPHGYVVHPEFLALNKKFLSQRPLAPIVPTVAAVETPAPAPSEPAKFTQKK
jgi:hypothetical protein